LKNEENIWKGRAVKQCFEGVVKPDLSSAMTLRVWTKVGRHPGTGATSYVNTIYRPNDGLEVSGPAHLPDASLEIN
jgi:hypothetical protein